MRKQLLILIAALAGVFLVTLLAGCGSGSSPQGADDAPQTTSGQQSGAGRTDGAGLPSTGAAAPTPESTESGSGSGYQDNAAAQPAGFLFAVKGLTIQMGEAAAPVVGALGEPVNYFEAPSCAFDGIDRIYCYSGFELFTYPVDGEDFISSINLTDDSVATREGVYLGMSLRNMIDAYGEEYEQDFGQYTYTLDDSTLSFLIEDDTIVVITYKYKDYLE